MVIHVREHVHVGANVMYVSALYQCNTQLVGRLWTSGHNGGLLNQQKTHFSFTDPSVT